MTVSLPKLQEAILFIASHPKVSDLGRTKLNKLLYYADVIHLREAGSSITGSEYIKYEHGPVPSRMDKAMKALSRDGRSKVKPEPLGDYILKRVVPLASSNTQVFSAEEIESLETACEQYGRMTALELSELSHDEPAYVNAEMLKKMAVDLMPYGPSADPDGL